MALATWFIVEGDLGWFKRTPITDATFSHSVIRRGWRPDYYFVAAGEKTHVRVEAPGWLSQTVNTGCGNSCDSSSFGCDVGIRVTLRRA